jgi:IS5 family transposase
MGGTVPHPTTLMKITTRCAQAAVDELNDALLAKAAEAKVLKTNRARADTTVVEANVAYPSDSGLLAKGVAKLVKTAKKLKAMGLATRTKLADKTRTVRARARSINANLRQRNDDRLAGTTPEGPTRIVSLHDPDARPIAKGRLGKPVEFGYKAQIVDNEDCVVLDHNVEQGNPPDAPMLEPGVARIKRRTGRAPRAVTADRGYGEAAVEDALRAAGVRHVVLPTKGKPNAARRQIENRRAFKRMVRWRTGAEGRISCLKRDFGLNRTRTDGLAGARSWCGHSVFSPAGATRAG